MVERESSERKSLLIRTILIVILILLCFLATILYVYLYPKTKVVLYDSDYRIIDTFEVKKYSTISSLPGIEKQGYTFVYWSYDDFGGRQLDPDKELDTDVLNLYANYEVNSYKVTYHVQEYDPITQQYVYVTYEPNGYLGQYDYGSEIILPTGRDNFNNLLPMFSNRKGFHFVGWTTKVITEDDPELDKYLYYAGNKFIIDVPSNIDLYAYFEKNEYTFNMHTGIEYELDGSGNPVKDGSGEYIIHNISDDPTNELESLFNDKLKYLDNVSLLSEKYKDITLTEKNAGMAYGEYEFKGWYLDSNYTISVDDENVTLIVDDNGMPLLTWKDDNLDKYIYPTDTGEVDVDNNPIYEFDLYSKWQRKAYTIDFNKNSNRSNGKIESIKLYRVFRDEQGQIIDEFGKYYDDGEFTYDGYANGGHYNRVNLETLDVVNQAFRDSNNKYRLVGWTDSTDVKNENTKWYSLWQQEPWTKELGASRVTGLITYANPIYSHNISQDQTLYAQWSQIYDIKFAYATGTNQKNFIISGIEGEWFILPDMSIKDKNPIGEIWEKTYNYFAGWTTGTSSIATKYLNKLDDGTLNPNYKYTIGRTSSTLIVLWMRTPYTINFYMNDDNGGGAGNLVETYAPAYGGTFKYFPSAPTRVGYIFDGWSKTDYLDGGYAKARREAKNNSTSLTSNQMAYTSSSNFKVEGDTSYYASWSIDYEIIYDANGGEFSSSSKTTYKYSELVGSTNSLFDLKVNLYVGKGISITSDNYIFQGWNLKISDTEVSDHLIQTSSTKRTTFDFYENKYYDYRAEGITIPDEDKFDLHLLNGKQVVLVANWEPKKYSIRIIDTLANEGETAGVRTDEVAFDQPYTFPLNNALGVPFDNKIGYKLEGFSTSKGGDIVYRYDPENMPVIEANTINSNLTFYTVYSEKDINLKYQFVYNEGSDSQYTIDYTPSVGSTATRPGTIAYGQALTLPIVTGADYGDSKYVFKYWYYLKNGQEVQIVTGDKAIYHDENDTLIIYAKFEVETYRIELGITNPYVNGSQIVTTILLGNYERNSQITQAIYDEIMSKTYDLIIEVLKDNVLNETIGMLKGYYLEGLFATGGYDDKFELNKYFSSTDFRILGINTNGMILATRWQPNSIVLDYRSSEESGAESKKVENLNFASTITLENNEFFDLGGGLEINSWYLIDPTNTDSTSNRLFVKCASPLVGNDGAFANLNDMQKYIDWDSTTGIGTIIIYANTQQICTVNYYAYDGTGVNNVNTVEFVYGIVTPELLSGDEVVFGDLKFEGWYYLGQKVDRIPVSKDNYVVDLYANMTFEIRYILVNIQGNLVTEQTLSTETISLLENFDEITNQYTYIDRVRIDQLPNLTIDQIPQGYKYFGLKYNDNAYSQEQIQLGIDIAVDGYNIILKTYYTKEYTVTYQLNDTTSETFEDLTTEPKIETYDIGYDNVQTSEITINNSALKSGFSFVGWKMKMSDGTLSEKVYAIGESFVLPSDNIIFVPVFEAPTEGTIDATIILYKEAGSQDTKTIKVTNGQIYTFAGTDGASSEWTSITHDLYKWRVKDGTDEYLIGDNFVVPVAINQDQVFEFVGVWIEKYTVNFTQPSNYSTAEYDIKSKSIRKGEPYTLVETPRINVDGIEFNYWIYESNGTQIEIYVGDTIVLNSDIYKTYNYVGNADGTGTHYLPYPGESQSYTFVGSWTTVTYDIILNIVNPDNTYEVLEGYKIQIEVPFGSTYGVRELLTPQVLALENDSRGIIGWTDSLGSTSVINEVLTNIKSNLNLYSVWQNKYSLTFATETNEFGYNPVISTSYYLPGENIDINNVVKNIYAKGYSTVYYENGKYVVIGNSNDYYQVVAFNCEWSGEKLLIGENNSFPSFEAQNQNMTLTPILEKVYKVEFYDNTTESGGNKTDIPDEFLREGYSINVNDDKYKISRDKFTFLGWNTDKNAELGIDFDITMESSNISLYAIWASDRKAVFQLSLSTSSGLSTTKLFELPLTKDNKINKTILINYLNAGNAQNNYFTPITSLMNLGHQAYSFNNKNLYLDGFKVIKNGVSYVMSIDDLCNEDFASSSYNINENITITLNTFDIYTIVYSTADKEGVEGEINSPDYVIYISDTKSGKLVDVTIDNPNGLVEFVLPQPAGVTRPYYSAYAWSTSPEENSTSATRYVLSNQDSITITSSELRTLTNNLQLEFTQEYTLYLEWTYEYVDVFVYALADVIDTDLTETTLVDPYNYYANSLDGSGIPFANLGNFIYVNGQRKYAVNNYQFNKPDGAINAELEYNTTFTIGTNSNALMINGTSLSIAGYRLIGFSTTLYRLGEEVESSDYFSIGQDITLNNDLLKNQFSLKLYPVYALEAESITISSNNGNASISAESTLVNNGYVAEFTGIFDDVIEQGKTYVLNLSKYSLVTITADSPSSVAYEFDRFEGVGTSAEGSNIRTILGSEMFESSHDDHEHYLDVYYTTKKIKLNINLSYQVELKDNVDDGILTFSGIDAEYIAFQGNIGAQNQNYSINVSSLSTIEYMLSNVSTYYTYELLSGDEAVKLSNGRYISIADLSISTDKNPEGYYVASIDIIAKPITYTVTFMMNKGAINEGTTIFGTSELFAGDLEFVIEKGVATVYKNTLITLPTAQDLTYISGQFKGFYLSGDATKTYVTTYEITKNTTFIEDFDDNAFSVQYIYQGNVKVVGGIPAGSEITVGIEEARNIEGYTLLHWIDNSTQNIISDNSTLQINKSYILVAVYQGNDININYVYNGNDLGKTVIISNGQQFTTLTENDLADATISETSYIYGWLYNGITFEAGKTFEFSQLGYIYDSENTTLTFTAVYYDKYKYEINYVTDGLTNADLFNQQIVYVNTTSQDGSSCDPNDLNYNINSVIPISQDDTVVFSKYLVEYSINGGLNYTELPETILIAGGILNLLSPFEDGVDINTPIKYRLTPQFVPASGTSEIKYIITNPNNTEEILKSDWTISFYTDNLLLDNYLPNILEESISNNHDTITWELKATNTTYDIQKTGLDWKKYSLVGYTIIAYSVADDVLSSKKIYFGNESDRNIAGAFRYELLPIWEERFVVYYFDENETEIIELRDYYDADQESIILVTEETFNSVNKDKKYNVVKDNHKWVGWATGIDTTITSNDDFYNFGENIVANTYNLYPAQSKIYNISFETIGIDESDKINFVFNEITLPQIYVGINETNTIDLEQYSFVYVYQNYDNSKYEFLGYSNLDNGENANFEYTFNDQNISGENLVIYATWQKRSYTITFTFEGYNNSNQNMLEDYYLNGQDALIKYYDEDIDLNFSYENNLYQTNYEILTNQINDIVSRFDYFKFYGFVIGQDNEGNDIIITSESQDKLYKLNQSSNIVVLFNPIYRVQYILPAGASYKDNEPSQIDTVLGEEIFEIGQELSIKYSLDDISWTGHTLSYWYGERVDKTIVNFFDGANDTHLFELSDINQNYVVSDNYRIKLSIYFDTSYSVSLYYFETFEDLQNYYALTPEEQASRKDEFYTQLGTPISRQLEDMAYSYTTNPDGSWNLEVLKDINGEPVLGENGEKLAKTIFDDYLTNNPLTINGKTVSNIYDFFDVFAENQYETSGVVTINNTTDLYAMVIEGTEDSNSLYYTQTYSGENSQENRLYLSYLPVKHKVILQTMAVIKNEDGSYSYDETLVNRNGANAEYALTEDEINDDGSESYDSNNQRRIIYPSNFDNDVFNYNNITLTYLDNLYIFDADKFVRANQMWGAKGYNFEGWKVLSIDDSDPDNIQYSFHDLSEFMTVIDNGDYINLNNIKQSLTIVAIFTENLVDIEIEISSTNNLGHTLDVKLDLLLSDGTSDSVDDIETIVDEINFTATKKLQAKYGSTLTISTADLIKEQYDIDSFKLGFYTYRTNTMTFSVDESAIDVDSNKILIQVLYDIKTYNVYISAVTELSGQELYGTVSEIKYHANENVITQSNIINTSIMSGGIRYNYFAEIMCNSILSAEDFAVPQLNNYTFLKWKYLNPETNSLVDFVESGFNSIQVTEDLYLVAEFAPMNVTIKYVIENSSGTQTEILGIDTPEISYGEYIELPYVVVELDDRISLGWSFDNESYQFGEQIQILTFNNEALAIENGNVVATIVADTIRKYYILYSAGQTDFDVSNYPTSKETAQSIIAQNIIFENVDYYYASTIDTPNTISVQKHENANFERLNQLIIPDYEVTSESGYAFIGWSSKLNNQYENNSVYEFNEYDVDDASNTITLTAINSNYVRILFYITNPTNTEEVLYLSQKSNSTRDLEYVSWLVDAETLNQILLLEYDLSNEQNAQFVITDGINTSSSYFTDNNGLTSNYKFYGWSIEKLATFDDITNLNNGSYDGKYVSIYDEDNRYERKNIVDITDELKSLIANKTSPITLFAIWEAKRTVTFQNDSGDTIMSGTYGMGDLIYAPNPTNTTLTNGSMKWIGWQSTDDINRPFVNNECTIPFIGREDVTYTPWWQEGYSLTLDMNFDLNKFANIMSTYRISGTVQDIINYTGYPYYSGSDTLVVSKDSGKVVNGNTYYSQYSYGSLWTVDETLDLSNLNQFSDLNIYPTSDQIELNYVTWLNSYYYFAGWSLTKDEPNILSQEELANFKLTGNTTLYAVWTPVTLRVNLYDSQEKAEAKGFTNNYVEFTFGQTLDVRTIENIFEKPDMRFSKWIPVTPMVQSTLYELLPIVNTLYLYPDFVDEYIVEFRTDQGELLAGQSEDNYQRVVDGETISITNYLKNTLQQNMNLIKNIYYVNFADNNVTISEDSITFSSSSFKKYDHTIIIFVTIDITINLYKPSVSTSGFELWKTLSLSIDRNYNVASGSILMGEFALNTDEYTGNPTVLGWNYVKESQTGSEYYLDNDNRIETFKVTSNNGTYSLKFTNSNGTYTVELSTTQGLVINLYAKLAIKATITLGDGNDNIVPKYANIEYEYDEKYVEINNVTMIGSNPKTIVYTTIYGSPHVPEFKIKTNGYVISSISNIENFDDVETSDYLNVSYSKNSTTDSYNAILQKTTNTDDGNMNITYNFKIESLKLNNQVYQINIQIFRFDASFVVNNNEGQLRYKTSSSYGEPQPFSETATIQVVIDNLVYNNGNESNVISVTYEKIVEENNTVIKFANIPYGMTLYVSPISNNLMLMHYSGLDFDWIDGDGQEWDIKNQNEVSCLNIDYDGTKFTFTPTTIIDSQFKNSYSIIAKFDFNIIRDVEFYLDVEAADLSSDSSVAWINALENVENKDLISKESDANKQLIRYVIKWGNMSTVGLEDKLQAGQSLTEFMESVNEKYHKQFDSIIQEDNELFETLQYFWFNDSDWYTDDKNHMDTSASGGVLKHDLHEVVIAGGTTEEREDVIYSLDDGKVVLHAKLTKAVIVQAESRVLNYVNNSVISDVDRANIKITEQLDNGYVFVDSNTNANVAYENNEYNKLRIKMPFNGNLKLEAVPNTATDKHVAYKLVDWFALNTASGNDGSSVFVKDNTNINLITLDFSAVNNNIPEIFVQFGTDTVYTLPEIRISADVVAETYDIYFQNAWVDDNATSETIKVISVAYDEEIYNADKVNKYYYMYDLNNLYKETSVHTMPRFALMPYGNESITRFAHNYDEEMLGINYINHEYGEFKYIFKGWIKNFSEENIVHNIDNYLQKSNLIDIYNKNELINYSENQYKNVTLYTCYQDTRTNYIRIYRTPTADGVDYDQLALYLVPQNFSDFFGNIYSDDSLAKEFVKDWLEEFNYGINRDDIDFYLKGIDNWNHVQVESMSQITQAYANNSSNLSEAGQFVVYPKVNITLRVYSHSADSQLMNYAEQDFATIGGKIIMNLRSKDDVSKNLYKGYLQLSNVILNIDETGELAYPIYPEYQFAYWIAGGIAGISSSNTNMYEYETYFNYYKDSNTEHLKVLPHFNAKVLISSSIWGGVVVEDNEENIYKNDTFMNLFETMPTQKFITKNINQDNKVNIQIEFAEEYLNAVDCKVGVLEINNITDNILLYKVYFEVTNPLHNNIAWRISTANGVNFILTEVGQIIDVEDITGYYRIEPVSFPDKVIINIEDFAITNLSGEYTDAYTLSAKTIEVEGGAQFVIESTPYDFDQNYKLSFIGFDGNAISGKSIVANNNSEYKNELKGNLINFRWQYKNSIGEWINFENTVYVDALNSGELSMNIRPVADWISYNVTFEKLSNFDANDFGESININAKEFTLNGGYSYNSYNIKVNGSEDSKVESKYVINVFKGEKIEYEYSNNKFLIKSQIPSRNQLEIILVEQSDSYVQGWLRNNAGMLEGLLEMKEYEMSEDMHFISWVEKEYTTTVNVDMTTSYNGEVVPGYGDVNYALQDPLSETVSSNILTIDKINKTYGTITTGYSTLISLTASKNQDVLHDLKRINYLINGSNIENGNTNSNGFIDNSKSLISDTIQILFDATSTKSEYYLVNEKQQILDTNTIYGGYQIDYTPTIIDGITTKTAVKITDYWGNTNKIFNINYTVKGTNDENNYYPRNNYNIKYVYSHWLDGKITTESTNTIQNELENGSDIAINTAVSYTTNSYIKNNYDDNSRLISKYDEFVRYLTLYYRVDVKSGDKTIQYNNLSQDTAYLVDEPNKTYDITRDIETASLQYDTLQSGIEMKISDTYTGIIRSDKYTLVSAELYSTISGNSKNLCEYPNNASISTANTKGQKFDVDILETPMTLDISLQDRQVSSINFKITLPEESDLRNLKVKFESSLDGIGVPVFNDISTTEDGKSIGTYTLFIPRGVHVYTEKSIVEGNTQWTLNFYKSGTTSSGNIATITYIVDDSYAIVGENAGWFIDTSPNHYQFENVTKTLSYSGSATQKYLDYQAYSFTPSTEIGSTKILLDTDATLVLAMERKPVEIIVDNNSWLSIDSTSLEKEKQFIIDCLNNYSISSAKYIVPSGLVRLEVTDDDKVNSSTTNIGDQDTNYLGGNTFPSNIKNYIRKGNLNLIVKNAQGESTTISLKSNMGLNSGFAVISEKNKEGEEYNFDSFYDVELRDGNKWVLLMLPYGDADKNISNSYTEITFYQYPKNYSGYNANLGTYNFNAESMLTLIQSLGKDDIYSEILYIGKCRDTRLFAGMSRTSSYDYLNVALEFRNNLDFKSGYRRLLTGFEIYDENGSQLLEVDRSKFGNKTYLYSLSAGKIVIYPIFENVKVYTVKVDSEISYVLDGDPFTYNKTLETRALYSTYGVSYTNNYYTIQRYNSQKQCNEVFMGMNTTYPGNFSLLYIDEISNTLKQHYKGYDLGGLVTSGTTSGKAEYQIKIPNVTQNITFTSEYRQVGYTITYYNIDVVMPEDSKHTLNEDYRNNSHIVGSVNYDLVLGLKFIPDFKISQLMDSKFNQDCFVITNYYKDESKTKNITNNYISSTELINNKIYYTILHHNHNERESYKNNIYCTPYYECDYCTYYYIKGHKNNYLETTYVDGGSVHEIVIKCTECGKLVSRGSFENHSFTHFLRYETAEYIAPSGMWTISPNYHNAIYGCTKCGSEYEQREAHDHYNSYYEAIGELRHRYVLGCDACGLYYRYNAEEHVQGNLIEEQSSTCLIAGYKKYECLYCDKTIKETLPKLQHIYVHRSVEATCISLGREEDVCIRCGKTINVSLSSVKNYDNHVGPIEESPPHTYYDYDRNYHWKVERKTGTCSRCKHTAFTTEEEVPNTRERHLLYPALLPLDRFVCFFCDYATSEVVFT